MDALLAVMFTVVMFSGVFLIWVAMQQRSQSLDRQHRERMAMIERGQSLPAQPVRRGSSLAMSLGIITVGVGLALMTLISIASEAPSVGIGVGGAIVIVGVAFIVRSVVVRPVEHSSSPMPPLPPPPAPPRITPEP